MKYFMKKFNDGFDFCKKTTAVNYDYAKLMLYNIVEKLIIIQEVFIPEYRRYITGNNYCIHLYHLLNRVAKSLSRKLRRTGVLSVKDTPFASIRNKLYTSVPYSKKRMFQNIAIDLYKLSKFEKILEGPFCEQDFHFDFDMSKLEGRDITVQISDINLDLIKSENFEELRKQAEQAFKQIETKEDLALYLSQFFNFSEDINDCHKIAAKKAC